MVQVSPQELRDFAAMLHPADFNALAQRLTGFDLSGGMPDAATANEFIKKWAPQVAGFGQDLGRGVEAFGTIAQNAAARFETTDQVSAGRFQTTDQNAKDIIATELNPVRPRDWTDSEGLPLPPPPPVVSDPPKPAATTTHDPDVDILAPGPFDYPTD
ncbi:hypothetical protein [Kribbella soli]|uniref:Uncharacterized protein n=1 Tax=Kribbella soli TaxID=1124743 RepID=A0A4R0H0Z9_9ACTN|nr:hypothetical protein [Kribbella soli]TCC04235.1 hypothetical protein E0H45_34720 [Kribbella soli]